MSVWDVLEFFHARDEGVRGDLIQWSEQLLRVTHAPQVSPNLDGARTFRRCRGRPNVAGKRLFSSYRMFAAVFTDSLALKDTLAKRPYT